MSKSSHRFVRIGHGGASAVVAANTLESFDAALELGVDMIEFDVRARPNGELVLAHTLLHARQQRSVRLHQALEHLSTPRFNDIGLNADLKRRGGESVLLDELRAAGLLERTLISSQAPAVLDRVRALEPRARIGISVGGHLSRRAMRWANWRSQVLKGLARKRWDALMAQHRLVDESLLDEVLERDALLYAWTVNDRSAIERLQTLGVHGIATADPRLFA